MKPKYAINALRMREPNILFTIDKSVFVEVKHMIQNAGLHSPLEKECLETICETVMKWLDGFAFTGIE